MKKVVLQRFWRIGNGTIPFARILHAGKETIIASSTFLFKTSNPFAENIQVLLFKLIFIFSL